MTTDLERTRNFYDAIAGVNLTKASRQALSDLTHPEAEFDVTAALGLPDEDVWRGRDAVLDGWIRWVERWSDYRISLESISEHGGHVLVELRIDVRGRHSGVPITAHQVQTWLWRDGLIYRLRSFADRESALRHLASASRVSG